MASVCSNKEKKAKQFMRCLCSLAGPCTIQWLLQQEEPELMSRPESVQHWVLIYCLALHVRRKNGNGFRFLCDEMSSGVWLLQCRSGQDLQISSRWAQLYEWRTNDEDCGQNRCFLPSALTSPSLLDRITVDQISCSTWNVGVRKGK